MQKRWSSAKHTLAGWFVILGGVYLLNSLAHQGDPDPYPYAVLILLSLIVYALFTIRDRLPPPPS